MNTSIEIVGSDASRTIFELGDIPGHSESPDNDGRFFTVLPKGRLSVSKITLRGGLSACRRPACGDRGGGVADNAGGELQFHDSVLSGNSSYELEGDTSQGGAIFNWRGHLLIERTLITGNSTSSVGGAIYIAGGTADIHDSIVTGNEAEFGSGCALFVAAGAHLNLTHTTISGNFGGNEDEFDFEVSGIAIDNQGTTSVVDSALTQNFSINGPGVGGAISNAGVITIQNTTISGNSIGTLGGGIPTFAISERSNFNPSWTQRK